MPSQPEALVLTNITVVDTETGKLTPDATVTLAGGKIASIQAGAPAPAGATAVDARGKFLVPGFLDMHVHSMQDPQPQDSLAMLLAHGVTGIRQMAGAPELLERRRQGMLHLGPDTPECLAMPGSLLTFANCPTPEAGVNEVRRQKEQGADFIKTIFVSPKTFFATLAEAKRLGLAYGGHLSPGVDVIEASKAGLSFVEHLGPTELTLIKCSRAEFIIRLAMRLKPPTPPALTPADIQGMTGKIMIANPILFRMNMDPKAADKTAKLVSSFQPEKARKLAVTCAENHTWQCPTLIRTETMQFGAEPRYTQSPDLRYIPAAVRQLWTDVARQYAEKLTPAAKETMLRLSDLSLRLVKTFDDNGVEMLAGSDYGGGWVIPGISLHQEFDLLAAAGLSPLKVLQMTTINGARFLKRDATMGTVAAGKEANLVLLNANPIDSVQNLHGIHAVIRDGRLYSADALTQLKERVAQSVATA
jgi:imidazolonepropionase-like amidohydrolase